MKSKYDGYYRDRVWDWKCQKVVPSPLIDCSWSPDINNWKQDITYMCPKNKFMAGELYIIIGYRIAGNFRVVRIFYCRASYEN